MPPGLVALTLPLFWILARIGAEIQRRRKVQQEDDPDAFAMIVGATLTMLALIVGFAFSMAVSRYDQRKAYEEQEANAIGTEYVRADVLPAPDAARVRSLLRSYLDQRVAFYDSDAENLPQINARTARLQAELWASVAPLAAAQPSPVAALVLAGMNEVLNSQGYTQAAWWNRIPKAAWALMITLGMFGNFLVGLKIRGGSGLRHSILPFALSVSLILIADIDSPRRGLIRVEAQNLQSLSESLPRQ